MGLEGWNAPASRLTIREPVFYSFHYGNDVNRVNLIRNIGAIDDNSPVSPNAWEEVRRKGDAAVKKWIDDNMAYRRCVIVLIGEDTASRPFVQYEIERAWALKKGLLGIHIHNLKCMRNGTCSKGPNPFSQYNVNGASLTRNAARQNLLSLYSGTSLSSVVRTYDPYWLDAYNDIRNNMAAWVRQAIADAKAR
jgi:hypothetical protein